MDVPPKCLLSDHAPPYTLSRRLNKHPLANCFRCGRGGDAFDFPGWHYYCDICKLAFHKDCITTLQGIIQHPYHLNHFLNLTIRFSKTETQSFTNLDEFDQSITKLYFLGRSVSRSNETCDWCGKRLGNMFYRCLVCGFSLDRSCVEKDPPLTITNPKSHQHLLNLFPRPLSVPCSACGLDDKKVEPHYFCQPCNFVVHKSCIDLPRVIKLTRHPHRLSYNPWIPLPAKRSCGVCHRNVDVKYGMYSCNKGCSYAVHSKCATHRDIWDGIDLEDVPEEPFEDLSPFEEVGYNLIKHFSHEHHLRFNEDGPNEDANKYCQACCRFIDSCGFYKCTTLHCDFFLHTACANFPKKKEHPVHKHPLVLDPLGDYSCFACRRIGNGFSYTCFNNSCENFKMDVICASVCEPFEHKVHPHPLYLFSGRDGSSLCGICGKEGNNLFTLKCNDCEFTMCFRCATIPISLGYKHDEHLLTLCGGEDSNDPYWCERCERQMDPKKWFYTCHECCTTIHIDCVFGDSTYIRTGSFEMEDYEFTFASNNSNSRPMCSQCGVRCLYPGFYKRKDICICSFECVSRFASDLMCFIDE